MALLSRFEHDVFISYARVDDQEGWVAKFHRQLEIRLSSLVGRMGVIRIWRDTREIGGNQLFDQTIQDAIGRSALFLALTSNGYLASPYCRQELAWFHARAGESKWGLSLGDRLRIFHLLLHNTPHATWPSELGRTSGFPFHDGQRPEEMGYPSEPDEQLFRGQMRKLSEEVYRTLQHFEETVPAADAGCPPDTGARRPAALSVFLADTADSLRVLRRRVVSELADKGVDVRMAIPPPYEAEAHDAAATAELQQADLCVHLFDAWPGREIQGAAETSYPRRQAEIARQQARPQLIWVPQALDPKTIEDGAYRELLEMLENGERGTARYRFLRGSASEMFSDNKATRINATTTVISKWSDEPALVPAVVRQARTDTANKSGIINSLVVLESVSPRRLRENDVAVSSLLDDVEKNGPQTAAYVDRLRSVLEPSRATRMSPR